MTDIYIIGRTEMLIIQYTSGNICNKINLELQSFRISESRVHIADIVVLKTFYQACYIF